MPPSFNSPVQVQVDPSEFPAAVESQIHASLQRRRLDQKLLYLTREQARYWNELHQSFSPWVRDEECQSLYRSAFDAAAQLFKKPTLDLVGLGCGPATKEAALISRLRSRRVRFQPVDASFPLLLEAASNAKGVSALAPYLCDLQQSRWAKTIAAWRAPKAPLLCTLFGVLPNLHPSDLFPHLGQLLQTGDGLLVSANLLPEGGSIEGVLPSYNNQGTRDWLQQFWNMLGVPEQDGRFHFRTEIVNWKSRKFARIAAWFEFRKVVRVSIGPCKATFRSGDQILMFYSYRYTSAQLQELLEAEGWTIKFQGQHEASGEGLFLVAKE